MGPRVVLLGVPGAGKGTQGRRLGARYGIPIVATGEILRAEVKEETALGLRIKEGMDRGLLVSDETMIEIVEARLERDDVRRGFILDGFPRTLPQARALDDMLARHGLPIHAAAYLHVPVPVVAERLSTRLECPACRRAYNPVAVPPRVDGACDEDGTALVARRDDDAESVRQRIEVYFRETAALRDYYGESGRLVAVDGNRDPDAVFADLLTALDGALAGVRGGA